MAQTKRVMYSFAINFAIVFPLCCFKHFIQIKSPLKGRNIQVSIKSLTSSRSVIENERSHSGYFMRTSREIILNLKKKYLWYRISMVILLPLRNEGLYDV